MKNKITLLNLISLVLLFAVLVSCGKESGEAVSTAAEPEETAAPETVQPDGAVLSEGFAFSAYLRERVTNFDDSKEVGLGTNTYKFEYSSTFYGASSMIKRDCVHMGNLFKSTRYSTEYPVDTGYVFGEFTGDKFDEYVCFDNGRLCIYEGGDKAKFNENSLLFTQKFDKTVFLCGTGDFNCDGFTDIAFLSENVNLFIGYGGSAGFEYVSYGVPEGFGEYGNGDFFTGDVNGDGTADIVAVKALKTSSWIIRGGSFVRFSDDSLCVDDGYDCKCVGDINSDGICDLAVQLDGRRMRVYFGRGDGHFGPYENETDNVNLYPTSENDVYAKYMTAGDVNGDRVCDIVGTMLLKQKKYTYVLVSMTYPSHNEAYDYSTHIIKKDDGTYILYNGGRYVDYNTGKYTETDGDHVLVYTSQDGCRWHRNLDAPAFYLGNELGESDQWWTGNTIEPEVVYVDGVYYMYYQCENYTHLEDDTLIGADRIGVGTSSDGFHFERKTDAPVIKNDPAYSAYDHEEVIYYEDDPDGLPFWMYVRHVERNVSKGYVRLRSADPYSFDFSTAESVSGFSQLGNQVGYCKLDDGSTVFLRITFGVADDRAVPVLQFSSDGIHWDHMIRLAGPDPEDPLSNGAKNCYFLGFSTVNGTGEMEKTEDGKFRFIYGACVAKSPVAPEIFYSNVGFGVCEFALAAN